MGCDLLLHECQISTKCLLGKCRGRSEIYHPTPSGARQHLTVTPRLRYGTLRLEHAILANMLPAHSFGETKTHV